MKKLPWKFPGIPLRVTKEEEPDLYDKLQPLNLALEKFRTEVAKVINENVDEAGGLYHPLGALVARNDQSSNYTLQASDAGKMVRTTSSTAVTVTIPSDTFASNDVVNVIQWGGGQITFAGSGSTLLRVNSNFNAKSLGQFSIQTIWFLNHENPVLGGMLELA